MPHARRLRDRRRPRSRAAIVSRPGTSSTPSARSGKAGLPARSSCLPTPTPTRSRSPQAHALISIAFPAISTGVYGFPPGRAAEIAVATVAGRLRATPHFSRVIFCCFSPSVGPCTSKPCARGLLTRAGPTPPPLTLTIFHLVARFPAGAILCINGGVRPASPMPSWRLRPCAPRRGGRLCNVILTSYKMLPHWRRQSAGLADHGVGWGKCPASAGSRASARGRRVAGVHVARVRVGARGAR